VGSKLSNRHGNKGCVSVIWPDSKMPRTETGEVAEIIINPLGVISRMNLGQLYEVHLNWASYNFVRIHKDECNEDFINHVKEFITMCDGSTNHAVSDNIKEYIDNHPNIDALCSDIRKNGLQLIQPPFHSITRDQLVAVMDSVNEL
jgi:DNA-directed RNA polymerase subunit beta